MTVGRPKVRGKFGILVAWWQPVRSDGGAAVEVLDSPGHVVVDEGGVHRYGGRGAFTGCGDDLRPRIGQVAGNPEPRDAGDTARGVGSYPPALVKVGAQCHQQVVVRYEPRWDEQRLARNDAAV